ncbi:hypothetical protein AVEN_50501-1 [Araneus ventricosus]|uniref:Uncharacterized protein n=1 Tax=Araneus ventricosus TaxID=182803 RepID=A0A4Y2ARZ4_ARAVE|nr:hypothetical protein AVEN_50501-1 [Araneus ventricosus]
MDLVEKPAPTFSKVDLVILIKGNTHYHEDNAKLMLDTVAMEREELLKLEAKEKEQGRLKKEFELEKLRMTSYGSTNPKQEKPSC